MPCASKRPAQGAASPQHDGAEVIQVACTFNRSYELQFIALAETIRRHAREPITLHAVHTEELQFAPHHAREGKRLSIRYRRLSDAQFAALAAIELGKPPAHIARLLLPELLPDVDRTIYLDIDTVVLRDLGDLFRADVGEIGIAACNDYALIVLNEVGNWISEFGVETFEQYAAQVLGLQSPKLYVNTGVLVLSLATLRESRLFETAIDIKRKAGSAIFFADQDAINIVAAGRCAPLDPRWNALAVTADRLDRLGETGGLLADPWIVHFAGPKPWDPPYDCPRAWDHCFWDAAMQSGAAWLWLNVFWAAALRKPGFRRRLKTTWRQGPQQSPIDIARHSVAHYLRRTRRA